MSPPPRRPAGQAADGWPRPEFVSSSADAHTVRVNEERLRLALDASAQAVWDWDVAAGRILVTPGYFSMLGYDERDPELTAGSLRSLIHPDDWQPLWEQPTRWPVTGDRRLRLEFRMRARDGEWRWMLASCRVVARDAHGEPVRVVGVNTDITDQRRAAEDLAQAVADRDALLREVHHRVKNNLQIVSSLLNLQLGQIRQPRLRELVRESCLRVQAIALAHERLYQSESLAAVEAGYYVRGLLASLAASFARPGQQIDVSCEADDVPMPLDMAVRLGLVVNELLTNAYKHAFRGRARGTVAVTLTLRDDDALCLGVADDGRGLPEDIDVRRTDSLGLQLVANLAAQLRGTLAVHRGSGTRFEVRFPLHPPA